MTSASLCLVGALLLGPPGGERQTPVLTPTQPQPGEPAIAPAQIDAERAGPEPMPALPTEPEPLAVDPDPDPSPDPSPDPDSEPATLPSWEDNPAPTEGPHEATPSADWSTPIAPELVATRKQAPPGGAAVFAPAIAMFGLMISSELATGLACEQDVYCGTRGWPWRALGLGTVGLAGMGGWLHGKRIAFDRAEAGLPAKNPIGRRAAGWSMFVLGLGGMIADTALYQLCYDGARGPYTQIEGFRYTCSPVISVVTLDLSTLVGATGLALALSGESQLRNRPKFEASVAPWGGRGQAGLSVLGRF
ncbi:MAG: hypothetical protein R6X02_22255 [Enhygromyxa sp.]